MNETTTDRIIAVATATLTEQKHLGKGDYIDTRKGNHRDLLSALGHAAGVELVGDDPDDPPPWYDPDSDYLDSPLAHAIGVLARAAEHYVTVALRAQIQERIGVKDDPMAGIEGDAYDRAILVAYNDNRGTSLKDVLRLLQRGADWFAQGAAA